MTYVNFNRPSNRTFNNFFNELVNELPGSGKDSSLANPPVNILETENDFQLELNVPGRSKEDFQVTVEKGLLTIAFEKKEEVKPEGIKSIRKEFTFSSFKRSFSLDDKVDAENIQAKYENGLLKFVLPKKAEVKESTKQISIQ
ncbi:MAG: Hsp20/alpha crystallin family protein [Chitinophagaceae bacterium]